MNNFYKKHQISEELIIYVRPRGVKLVRSDQVHQTHDDPLFSLRKFFSMPFNTYIMDKDSKCIYFNASARRTIGRDQIFGQTVFDYNHNPNAALKVRNNDVEVLTKPKLHYFIENHVNKDGSMSQFLSFKAPLLDDKNQIIGIIGCSTIINPHSLPHYIYQMSKIMGLIDENIIRSFNKISQVIKISNARLSKQDIVVLQHLVRGKSAKQIATLIHRSQRTIEQRLEQIKNKLGIDTRAELVEMIVDACFQPIPFSIFDFSSDEDES